MQLQPQPPPPGILSKRHRYFSTFNHCELSKMPPSTLCRWISIPPSYHYSHLLLKPPPAERSQLSATYNLSQKPADSSQLSATYILCQKPAVSSTCGFWSTAIAPTSTASIFQKTTASQPYNLWKKAVKKSATDTFPPLTSVT